MELADPGAGHLRAGGSRNWQSGWSCNGRRPTYRRDGPGPSRTPHRAPASLAASENARRAGRPEGPVGRRRRRCNGWSSNARWHRALPRPPIGWRSPRDPSDRRRPGDRRGSDRAGAFMFPPVYWAPRATHRSGGLAGAGWRGPGPLSSIREHRPLGQGRPQIRAQQGRHRGTSRSLCCLGTSTTRGTRPLPPPVPEGRPLAGRGALGAWPAS